MRRRTKQKAPLGGAFPTRPTGFEPVTFGSVGLRSSAIWLPYGPLVPVGARWFPLYIASSLYSPLYESRGLEARRHDRRPVLIQALGRVVLRHSVDVAHGRLDVFMTQPLLHVGERVDLGR